MLLLQQLFNPEPSHKRSTAGKGIPAGATVPLLTSVFCMILLPSGLGSMSAKAEDGRPASAPKTKVLTVAKPRKLLFFIKFSFIIVLSEPKLSTPTPLGI